MAQAQSGWITYYPNWDLDQFLEKHRPSQETSPDVFWISVRGSRVQDSPQRDLGSVQVYWNQLTSSNTKINADDLKAIAIASGYTSGKWMIFRKPDLIDDVWNIVAKATVEGKLGTAAKVSSRSSSQASNGQSHVICVYTQDFTDQADVLRVEGELRRLGVEGEIMYKADLYTELGIYFRNPWGLKPTLYTSKPGADWMDTS